MTDEITSPQRISNRPVAPSWAPPWLVVAHGEIGVVEAPGDANTQRVLEYLSVVGKGPLFRRDSTPWCSAFVNWAMQQAGYVGSMKANARSWLTWGADSAVRVGAVAVFKRGLPWQGHVAIVVGSTPTHVRILGGNQHNRVCVEERPRHMLLGCRWPA